jgi:heme oxygenase
MADSARLTASRGGNRCAATRLVNKITDIHAHYKALINLLNPTATHSSLLSFLDQLESHIRSLEALGTPLLLTGIYKSDF